MFQRSVPLALCALAGWALASLALSLGGARAELRALAAPGTPPAVGFQSPAPGEALQGNVPVVVYAQADGFTQAEVFFGYTGDASGARFPLGSSAIPLSAQTIVLWDTTLISDGDYTLYLVVTGAQGKTQESQVAGVRVRNYSPVETDTPAPTQTAAPGAPTATPQPPAPTLTPPVPTATPLPPNPAEITPLQVFSSVVSGAAAGLGLLALAGLYLTVRRWLSESARR